MNFRWLVVSPSLLRSRGPKSRLLSCRPETQCPMLLARVVLPWSSKWHLVGSCWHRQCLRIIFSLCCLPDVLSRSSVDTCTILLPIIGHRVTGHWFPTLLWVPALVVVAALWGLTLAFSFALSFACPGCGFVLSFCVVSLAFSSPASPFEV